jgi:hypothetical protein
MLTVHVYDQADNHIERAFKMIKGRFAKDVIASAKACAYRRALYHSDMVRLPFTLILSPDTSELSASDQRALRDAERQAVQVLQSNGLVVLAFGDPATGRASFSRILNGAGVPAHYAGERP